MTKFIGIRSKMYGYEYITKTETSGKPEFKCVAKGVQKEVKKKINLLLRHIKNV